MRSTRFILAFLLLSVATVAQNKPDPGLGAVPAGAIVKLAWLSGHWRQEKAGRLIDEHWMAPAGGMMLGMARTVSKGKMLEYEFVQIREGPGGELYYVALPSGQKEAAFKLLSLTDTEVVFENKLHDFPQTIGYRRGPEDTAIVVLEGPGPGGVTKRIEFLYKRVQ